MLKGKEETLNKYDKFIRECLAAGFTDDQADFLWDKMASLSDKFYIEEAQ